SLTEQNRKEQPSLKAILYIGHGTRSKTGLQEAKAFIQRVMERSNVPIQEISFLELAEPTIAEGFRRCVERGATEITVVPLFLLAAAHIKEDIPKALNEISMLFPKVSFQITDPFGIQDCLLDGLAELIKDTAGEVSENDSVLIVGRGSSDPAIQLAFDQIANCLQCRLDAKRISVCFLAACRPTLTEGLERLTEETSERIIVVPYLLFSGLLLNEVQQKVRRLQKQGHSIISTIPLSRHKIFEDLLIQRISN
ncbi:sirohydrochlorin chelatase, partial [Bacillus sp. JJ1764]|uniref:sirohydrochlorin chelatase n=1 Tax=Bacillus sp. JJ1764 TaxID=3122964 RepID=UPI002FFDFB9E